MEASLAVNKSAPISSLSPTTTPTGSMVERRSRSGFVYYHRLRSLHLLMYICLAPQEHGVKNKGPSKGFLKDFYRIPEEHKGLL